MKVISYNIHDCYSWKVENLLKIDADIWVVPEMTSPEDANLPEFLEMKWYGISYFWQFKRWKGLGVIWKKGLGYVPEWFNPELYYAIPLVVDDMLVLAIWPTKKKNVTDQLLYPQIAQGIINEYAPHFKDFAKVLVIGDFNCYVNQVDNSKEYGDILRIDSILSDYGLRSLYHQQTGEALGEETMATYYHRFNENSPFFLDYAYSNATVKSFRLLPWDKEMSDHVGMELYI